MTRLTPHYGLTPPTDTQTRDLLRNCGMETFSYRNGEMIAYDIPKPDNAQYILVADRHPHRGNSYRIPQLNRYPALLKDHFEKYNNPTSDDTFDAAFVYDLFDILREAAITRGVPSHQVVWVLRIIRSTPLADNDLFEWLLDHWAENQLNDSTIIKLLHQGISRTELADILPMNELLVRDLYMPTVDL